MVIDIELCYIAITHSLIIATNNTSCSR